MELTATVELDAYIQAAHDAGSPDDQVRRFVSSGYVALPKLLPYHALARRADAGSIREIMLDGTRGSAKSHAVIAQVGLDDCQRAPELKFLFLRQTQRAAAESFADLVSRVLRGIEHSANSDKITFPNRSRVVIGGYNDEHDIDKYIGIEYDGLVLEEATQISGERYERIMGSIRTSRDDWTPRIYLSTNPGGIGHSYYKDRFIQPNREQREKATRRIFTSYRDNPFIDQGYRDYLDGLTGDLAKAWRDGDWDVFAGQAFPTWRHDTHVIQPQEVPPHWLKWRAVDWGYSAPMCCLWMTKDPDNGRIYVYRELYQAGLTDRQQARMILDMTPDAEHISTTYADPSMWQSKTTGETVTSTADEYSACGVYLTKADNDRLSGKRKVDRLLAPMPDGKPGVLVHVTCSNLIRTLPALPYDRTRTEDVDTDAEDHAYDALRYGLTTAREYKPKTTSTWVSPYERQKVL